MFKDFVFRKGKSETSKNSMLKKCHLADGKEINSKKCMQYLETVKNDIVLSLGINSDKNVTDDTLNTILKKHHHIASGPIKPI